MIEAAIYLDMAFCTFMVTHVNFKLVKWLHFDF